MMSRDLSARPHEILNLRIKDVMFKTVDDGMYPGSAIPTPES
jgi:hypothetical protein